MKQKGEIYMPKIQIDIPEEVYKKLKEQAASDERSLAKYLIRGLAYLSSLPGGYHTVTAATATDTAAGIPTYINGQKIKRIEFEKTNSKMEELELKQALQEKKFALAQALQEQKLEQQKALQEQKLQEQQKQAQQKAQEQAQKNKDRLYAYFKKKFTEVWKYYMNGNSLPVAFRPSAMDYILMKYNTPAAIDDFVDNQLEHVNFDDATYDFYQYEAYIEEREAKLVVPYEQNIIYQTIKNYCLEHDLSVTFYAMIEYPGEPIFDNLIYFSKDKNEHSFLYDILPDNLTEQDIVTAMTWYEKEEGV